jgi:hypothetical protein
VDHHIAVRGTYGGLVLCVSRLRHVIGLAYC